ncbi:MAG: gamma-glutamyl-gamma-aminobutyrate hydrolase family protein [Paenibacillus sp.]|jgi:putative glutamine amidotransferase|nr:gamma-glutamyl-gamma-aminobutyrate hydrolase family protein [Paenibacillus sp.]
MSARGEYTGLKPLIGLTPTWEEKQFVLNRSYVQSVFAAGGVPLILPMSEKLSDWKQIAETIDGLVLTGGADLNPEWYGEEPSTGLGKVTPGRDIVELALVRAVMEQNKPIAAICRGVQLLNVAMGGSLYQDLKHSAASIQHAQQAPSNHLSHLISIREGSRLHSIAGAAKSRVNSFHHQAVNKVAPGFQVSATASDGVIEAIELEGHPFCVGVQWHPEESSSTDSFSSRLFASFVEACLKTMDTTVKREVWTTA